MPSSVVRSPSLGRQSWPRIDDRVKDIGISRRDACQSRVDRLYRRLAGGGLGEGQGDPHVRARCKECRFLRRCAKKIGCRSGESSPLRIGKVGKIPIPRDAEKLKCCANDVGSRKWPLVRLIIRTLFQISRFALRERRFRRIEISARIWCAKRILSSRRQDTQAG